MWHVALAWFLLLGSLGFTFPYFGLYLLDGAELSGTQAGLVLASGPVMSVICQPIFASLADRTGARTRLLSALALCAGIALFGIFFARGFGWLLFATALYATFSVTLVPGLWAVSYAIITPISPRGMGMVRASGTVGFAVAVVGFPWLSKAMSQALRLQGSESLSLIFPFGGFFLLLASATLWALPLSGQVGARATSKELWALLANRPLRRLLLVMFTSFLALHGPIVFLPVLMHSQSGDLEAIGRMWLFMLVPEVFLVFGLGWSVARFGARLLIVLGLFAGALRWLLSASLSDVYWITLAQGLNAVVLWGSILGGAAYADDEVLANQRSTAQSLVSVVGAGLGATCSTVAAGFLLEWLGPTGPAYVGGTLALALAMATALFLPESKSRRLA